MLLPLLLCSCASGDGVLPGASMRFAPTTQPADIDAHRVLHANATAALFNARCLDGSNGGFYFRPASSAAAKNKWKFHFQGGAWCADAGSCAARSRTSLGSSKAWGRTLGAKAVSGLMSASVNATGQDVGNPFGSWNFVWLAYCDGSSQTSDRADPWLVDDGTGSGNNVTLHLRGRALLDAHLHELEARYGFLSEAEEVILSGTSAGGMSAFLHASFVKSQLRAPGARLVAVPDAGFWWDVPRYGYPSGSPSMWTQRMTQAIAPDVWNATLRGGLAVCLAAPPGGGALANCYTQPYAYAFLDVPTFVVQSLVDPANIGFCWNPLGCQIAGNTPGNCNATSSPTLTDFAAFSDSMKGNITAAQAQFGSRDGHFLTSCNQHEETCTQLDWWGITIGTQTMNSTFYTWYTQGGSAVGSSAVDVAWPGDGSCGSWRHGAC